MPIDTFGFPMPQAFSGGADFTPLANLGNVYQQGQAQQRQLAALGQLGSDPTQNAMALIKSGDPQLAVHGINLMNQITQQQRYAAQEAEQKREFDITSGLAERKFQADSPEARRENLKAANIDPNSAAAAEYLATGQNFPSVKPVGEPVWRWVEKDGERTQVPFQRMSNGEMQPLAPVEGTPGAFVNPAELAEEKRGVSTSRQKEIDAQDSAALSAQRAIQSANRSEELAKKSLHLGTWFSGAASSVLQHLPAGTPGREAAIATQELGNEQLRQMMTHVKDSFGGRPSDKEDQWQREAEGAIGADFETQKRIIQRGRQMAEDNLRIARKSAEDMRSGEYYKKGYKPPEIPVETGEPQTPPGAPPAPATAAAAPASGGATAGGPLRAATGRETNMAKAALAQGKDPKAVRQRMIETGIDPGEIGQ